MVYSHNKKIIFVHIPKCGGTTIERAFGLLNPNNGYGINKGKAMQHYIWKHYKNELDGNIFNNYFKFSIVRNPYTRFISEYYWCVTPKVGHKGKQSIDNFISYCKKIVDRGQYNETIYHDHFMPQYLYIYDDKNNLKVNKLFKFENYPVIHKFMLDKYNIKTAHHGKGSYGKEKIILTKSQKERIYNIYKQDFIIFNYKK